MRSPEANTQSYEPLAGKTWKLSSEVGVNRFEHGWCDPCCLLGRSSLRGQTLANCASEVATSLKPIIDGALAWSEFSWPGIHSRLVNGHIHLGICGLAFVPGPCTFFLSFFHITMCSCWERDLLFLLRNKNPWVELVASMGGMPHVKVLAAPFPIIFCNNTEYR